eukprot:11879201-Alexandrium_andersonii.AAC.1
MEPQIRACSAPIPRRVPGPLLFFNGFGHIGHTWRLRWLRSGRRAVNGPARHVLVARLATSDILRHARASRQFRG